MSATAYNIANLIGLVGVMAGTWFKYGVSEAFIGGGALLLALNLITLLIATRRG